MRTGQTPVGEGQLQESGEFWTLGSDDILLRILLRKRNTLLALAVISDISRETKTLISDGDYSDRRCATVKGLPVFPPSSGTAANSLPLTL